LQKKYFSFLPLRLPIKGQEKRRFLNGERNVLPSKKGLTFFAKGFIMPRYIF